MHFFHSTKARDSGLEGSAEDEKAKPGDASPLGEQKGEKPKAENQHSAGRNSDRDDKSPERGRKRKKDKTPRKGKNIK